MPILCGKPEDNVFKLAESFADCLGELMEWDLESSNGAEIAARIAELQHEELDRFFRDHIKRRNLHQVVANLNETALSKDNPLSSNARVALKKLGFIE